jgi:hypothetical protein
MSKTRCWGQDDYWRPSDYLYSRSSSRNGGDVSWCAKSLIQPTFGCRWIWPPAIKAGLQVIPEHKFKVVERSSMPGIMVANDWRWREWCPALKKANVGIAVEGRTDAARSASEHCSFLLQVFSSNNRGRNQMSREILQRMRSHALLPYHIVYPLSAIPSSSRSW